MNIDPLLHYLKNRRMQSVSRPQNFHPARLSVAWMVLLVGMVSIGHASDDPGHSRHGSAFDSGLRQRPWKMEGIGHTHFPITTKVPEVQEWFDQGNTLLHSFWFEEAERSFRWCLKLDPECAMAYWGLARCGLNWFARGPLDTPEMKRYLDFLSEAGRRKNTVSERERLYIQAWEASFTGDAFTKDGRERADILARRLQELVLKFPDDIEGRSLCALFSIAPSHALANELLIQQVLAKEPDHPGAHHYRIHNWDGAAPEQGLPSCLRYGPVAPNIGHANHMPGHNYTKMGLWHEAARSMDSATRVELRYMNQQLALPFETWNFAHNRNYLCWIQEQLGMVDASVQGARDLLAAPRDPEANKDNTYGAFDQGMIALVRALLKFERWDEVLTTSNAVAIPWRETPEDKELRAFAETLAHIGKGDLAKARVRLQDLKTGIRQRKEKTNETAATWAVGLKSAEGILLASEGNLLDATRMLTDAAALEKKQRDAGEYENDPPINPWPVNRVLGDVYLNRGEHRLAVEAYERALAQEPYDAFTLSGLARARFALGDRAKAENDYGRLLHVWSGANANLRWMTSVTALGLKTAPIPPTLAPERPYRLDALVHLGPLNWEPYAAPKLSCLDTESQPVTLEQFRGKNVILVFYLNDECVHCVEQLKAINGKSEDWSNENTVVLGVSSTSPEKNKESTKLGKLPMHLLSDRDHENARRFASYDDFEELELHSTLLIDTQGRVHWKRTGGKPFADVEFLLQSVKRMNQQAQAGHSTAALNK
jgi:peroxiredoxin